MVDGVEAGVRRRCPTVDRLLNEKHLPVPRVEGSVIARVPAEIEQDVAADVVAAAEAIVVVDACTRAVEEDVVYDGVLHGLGLEPRLKSSITN